MINPAMYLCVIFIWLLEDVGTIAPRALHDGASYPFGFHVKLFFPINSVMLCIQWVRLVIGIMSHEIYLFTDSILSKGKWSGK